MTMPRDAQHHGGSCSKLLTPVSKSSKRDAGQMHNGNAFSAPIEIHESKEKLAIHRLKRQKCESETYVVLHSEYINLHSRTESANLSPFLAEINKNRLKRLESPIQSLAMKTQTEDDQRKD